MLTKSRLSAIDSQQDAGVTANSADVAVQIDVDEKAAYPPSRPFTTLQADNQNQSPQSFLRLLSHKAKNLGLPKPHRLRPITRRSNNSQEQNDHAAEKIYTLFYNTFGKSSPQTNWRTEAAIFTNISELKSYRLIYPTLKQLSREVPYTIATGSRFNEHKRKHQFKITNKMMKDNTFYFLNLTSQHLKERNWQKSKWKASKRREIKPIVQTAPSKRYLIYLCDHKVYCYGLGDRQRGIVGVYMLAILTSRRFGIVMTSPSNFTEFYKPTIVNWDIQAAELVGMSSIEIDALGPKNDLHLDKIDFNAEYPQDVVYIRTNHKLVNDAAKNPLYINRFPEWANVPPWRLFQVAWLRIVTPTHSLRQDLNEVLSQIAGDMEDEYHVWKQLSKSRCCKRNNFCGGSRCGFDISFDISNINDQVLEERKCINILKSNSSNNFKSLHIPKYVCNFCNRKCSIMKPNITRYNINTLKGFDLATMNMMCVHVRLGRSRPFPLESVTRNKEAAESAVWRFIQPSLSQGQPVYLVTDSEELKERAKSIFANRLHVRTRPVAHMGLVQEEQNQRSSFRLALLEQLLLATSCTVLMVSNSRFGIKAAQLRQELQGYDHSLFMYKNGSVFGKSVHWLP